jgi:hypothetical protein
LQKEESNSFDGEGERPHNFSLRDGLLPPYWQELHRAASVPKWDTLRLYGYG